MSDSELENKLIEAQRFPVKIEDTGGIIVYRMLNDAEIKAYLMAWDTAIIIEL